MIVFGLVLLDAALVTYFFLVPPYRIDLDVYRLGAEVWLAGGDLYGLLPPTEFGHLPFTYPPFAAVLFAPLTLVPLPVASVVSTALSIAALVLVVVVVLRSLEIRPAFVLFFLLRGDRRAAVTALVSFLGATAVGFLLNPAGSCGTGRASCSTPTASAGWTCRRTSR